MFRQNEQKNRDQFSLGGPPGLRTPPKHPPEWLGAPPKARPVPFFCLFGLNNVSKIFQKQRIFKLLLGGTHVGYPLGGAPPRPLRPPQGSLGVTEFWKKLQKFPKII